MKTKIIYTIVFLMIAKLALAKKSNIVQISLWQNAPMKYS